MNNTKTVALSEEMLEHICTVDGVPLNNETIAFYILEGLKELAMSM